jgi:hypothetical protein
VQLVTVGWLILLELTINCLQARMDPKNGTKETSSFGSVTELTPEEFQNQEAGYVYRYRYNGGAASQVWLSHGRCGTLSRSEYLYLYGCHPVCPDIRRNFH